MRSPDKLAVLNEARKQAGLETVDRAGPALRNLLKKLTPDDVREYTHPLRDGVMILNAHAEKPEHRIIIDTYARNDTKVI